MTEKESEGAQHALESMLIHADGMIMPSSLCVKRHDPGRG